MGVVRMTSLSRLTAQSSGHCCCRPISGLNGLYRALGIRLPPPSPSSFPPTC